MREILFRGKQIDDGAWVEGDLIHGSDRGTDKRVQIRRQGMYVHSEYYLGGCGIDVIPETIGEWTGLTDKNGKRIFEGDIVKFGDIIGIINFNIGCYCVKTNKPDWRSRNNPAIDIVINEYPNEIEVIGNIHDNPELLQEAEK